MAFSSAKNYQTATWCNHVFCPPGTAGDSSSSGIWDGRINLVHELDVEQQETTEGQNQLEKKGGDKQRNFSISLKVIKPATGQSPLAVYLDWKKSLGKQSRFYIGGKPIDSSQYILKTVALDYQNKDIAADGAPFMGAINLSFEEETILQQPTKETTTSDGKKTASKAGPSDAAKKAEIEAWQKELFGPPQKKK